MGEMEQARPLDDSPPQNLPKIVAFRLLFFPSPQENALIVFSPPLLSARVENPKMSPHLAEYCPVIFSLFVKINWDISAILANVKEIELRDKYGPPHQPYIFCNIRS